MIPLGGATETTKDHGAFRVVLGVLDGEVPEQMAVHDQKLVRPGPHLSPLLEHDPCPPIPRPGFAAREEVCGHIIQPIIYHVRCDLFSTVSTFQRRQVGVEVPGHQKHRPAGALADGRDNTFDANRVVGGQVKTENEPALSSQRHLETQNVRPMTM